MIEDNLLPNSPYLTLIAAIECSTGSLAIWEHNICMTGLVSWVNSMLEEMLWLKRDLVLIVKCKHVWWLRNLKGIGKSWWFKPYLPSPSHSLSLQYPIFHNINEIKNAAQLLLSSLTIDHSPQPIPHLDLILGQHAHPDPSPDRNRHPRCHNGHSRSIRRRSLQPVGIQWSQQGEIHDFPIHHSSYISH